jgi:hypothetical protein
MKESVPYDAPTVAAARPAGADGRSLLEEARYLSKQGFNVLPTTKRPGHAGKRPALPWNKYQTETTAGMIEGWFASSQYQGIWTLCGWGGLIVLDLDSPEAEAWWRSIPGMSKVMDETTHVATREDGSRPGHYWFLVGKNRKVATWRRDTKAVDDIAFDVQADGAGVMTPPSPHSEVPGTYYRWVRDIDHLKAAPEALLSEAAAMAALAAGSEKPSLPRQKTARAGGESAVERSILAHLLATPPEKGGRNNTLAKICGHLANPNPLHMDGYRELARIVAYSWPATADPEDPFSDADIEKTLQSIWKAEREKPEGALSVGVTAPEEGAFTTENGWLVGVACEGGGRILTTSVKVKDADGSAYEEREEEWADFDIEVLGERVSGVEAEYDVRITTQRGEVIEDTLSGAVLGSSVLLTTWLYERGCVISQPSLDKRRLGAGGRLVRYMRSQNAPVWTTVDKYGWDEETGGFLTPDGVIYPGATEMAPFGTRRPRRDLANLAPCRFGFEGTPEEALETFKTIKTFSDETTMNVAASWGFSALHKPFMADQSVFPNLGIEAGSGSGKTTGGLNMLFGCFGVTEHGQDTMPALRDKLSASESTPVWADDVGNLPVILEMWRQGTTGGSRTKKGADRHTNETVTMTAPLIVSGEALGAIAEEKALMDRAIRISPPSPENRKSFNDPEKSQWSDVLALRAKYGGDLTRIAGHIVAQALLHRHLAVDLEKWRPMASDVGGVVRPLPGRQGTILAAVRAGAEVQAAMGLVDQAVQGGGVVRVVDDIEDWVAGQVARYEPTDTYSSMVALPLLLRFESTNGTWATSPENNVAAWVVRGRDGLRRLWVREKLAQDRLLRPGLNERERSLVASMGIQRERLGAGGEAGVFCWTDASGKGRQMRGYEYPPDVTERILRRSELMAPDENPSTKWMRGMNYDKQGVTTSVIVDDSAESCPEGKLFPDTGLDEKSDSETSKNEV